MGIAQYDVNKVTLNNTERIKYFDNVGKSVQSAGSLEAAMKLSGLDFAVEKMPIYFSTECIDADTGAASKIYHTVPDTWTTVRSDTLEPLGIVGKNYNILQNRDAFDFLDNIVGAGKAKFETAGYYGEGGAKSFITISTEETTVLGDKYSPYILIMNSFDGSGAVRVIFTNIRIFCSNCLERAIKGANDKMSIRHSNSLRERLEGARLMLSNHTNYLTEFKKEAETLAAKTFTADQYKTLINELLPIHEEDSQIVKVRQEVLRDQMLSVYNMDDLQNFNNTAWKAVQAIADYESHKPMFRNTKNMNLANMKTVVDGMPLLNSVTNRLLDL